MTLNISTDLTSISATTSLTFPDDQTAQICFLADLVSNLISPDIFKAKAAASYKPACEKLFEFCKFKNPQGCYRYLSSYLHPDKMVHLNLDDLPLSCRETLVQKGSFWLNNEMQARLNACNELIRS